MSITTANVLPTEWADTEQLDGLTLVDKAELEGTPFRITAVWFETNERGVNYVYVDAELADGTEITFNDSSKGVRAQIVSRLSALGQDHVVDTNEVVPMLLVIPNGLRKSEFTVRDDKGKEKLARTFYLTTSGKRPNRQVTTGAKAKKS